jgi:hypothetical protein
VNGVHFFAIEYTTAVRGLPHSKQHAFNRDVINPQDGHILCVPYPAICGFRLRILRSSRIVTSAIRRPKEILVAFINDDPLLGEFRFERAQTFQCPTVVLRAYCLPYSDRLGTLGHNQHCQTGAVSRTFAAISSVLLTCADAVPPTPQARADIVELIDFAQDRFKRHGKPLSR